MARVISMYRESNRLCFTLSGTLGDKVYGIWKGVPYVRSKPTSVANPRTEKQLQQRAKHKAILKFLQPLTIFLRIGFKNYSADMSPFNAAMSYNIKNAIFGTYPDYVIDYSRVLVSRGSLIGALNPKISLTPIGEIEFTWRNNTSVNYAMSYDKVLLVIYNTNKQEVIFKVAGNSRESESQVIALPSTFEGDEVHCYIAFQNFQQTAVSDSQYVGSLGL